VFSERTSKLNFIHITVPNVCVCAPIPVEIIRVLVSALFCSTKNTTRGLSSDDINSQRKWEA